VSPKTIIVNADDFGDSEEVNSAVIEAYKRGILRFASLMVLRPAAAQAARLAKEEPGLGVGLHLELCADEPEKAGLRYFFDRRARASLEHEIRSQFEKLIQLGIHPTHVDGHINIHVHPVIFPILCRVAREYSVGRIRLPSSELGVSLDYPADADPILPRMILAATFTSLRACLRPYARGMMVPRTWGLLRSGRMTEDYVLWLLSRLPEGTTEIYFHPSSNPASQAPEDRPTLSHQTITELKTLTSPRVQQALRDHNITLVRAEKPTNVS
jgi:predicted glycoside hydrolase/deacetylase ChbG (UPF0249 family)